MSVSPFDRYCCNRCNQVFLLSEMRPHESNHAGVGDPKPGWTRIPSIDPVGTMTPPASVPRTVKKSAVRASTVLISDDEEEGSPLDAFSHRQQSAAYAAVAAANTSAGLVDRAKSKSATPSIRPQIAKTLTVHVYLWLRLPSGTLVTAAGGAAEIRTVNPAARVNGPIEIQAWLTRLVDGMSSYHRLWQGGKYERVEEEPLELAQQRKSSPSSNTEITRSKDVSIVAQLLKAVGVDYQATGQNREKGSLAVVVPAKLKDIEEEEPAEQSESEAEPVIQPKKRGRPRKEVKPEPTVIRDLLQIPTDRKLTKRPSTENLEERPVKRIPTIEAESSLKIEPFDEFAAFLAEEEAFDDAEAPEDVDDEEEEEADEDELTSQTAEKPPTPRSRLGRKLYKKERS